ncbi:type II toxin-antitoxin system PemK/MazF family toxin [Methylobacterium trifolii]|uniref:Endoribonuclease MazF n=1 Tax=Methylobacterium trifolii TaxID=1003092 RepID=A0ABQ4U0H5_9HYPH|nr:type II toxin-antitoxin system PemK/MazF family toxin [Methylobacterium trifolii]GJE60988.1 putative endoribonuclease MazF [Methylobacterium trifolii]
MAGALIRRGALVTVVLPGEYGKPRPALVVQADLFDALPSATVCPLTTTLRQDAELLRLTIEPSPENGLRHASQIVIDKISTVARGRVGGVIGHADDRVMLRVNRALALYLGLA